MSYNVYTAEYLGIQRNHISIFVETNERDDDKSGRVYHVVGSILDGMTYEVRDGLFPDAEPSYVDGTLALIGTVRKSAMQDFEAVCEAVEVPGRQMTLGGKWLDPSRPVRRCGEWVEDAKRALIEEGVVK